jgi:adenylylsulfate kinase
MAGVIKDFTGVTAPYEAPENPSLTIRTDAVTPVEAAQRILELLGRRRIV